MPLSAPRPFLPASLSALLRPAGRWLRFGRPALGAAVLMLASACGGGGSSSSTTPGGTTTTTSTTTTTPTGSTPVITGFAATGAPLTGAVIKVVDGAGQPVMLNDGAGNAVASTLSNAADGSFRLTLVAAAPVMPLLIEATGRDAKGTPVILHSVVQANVAPAVAVANITPLTDAIIAEMVGGNPRTVFVNASSNVATLALLTSSANQTLVSDHIKAIAAASVTDVKITNKALNFFTDPLFTTDKTQADALIEELRIQLLKNSAGKDILAISNKMTPPGTTEVRIDLAAARTELAKTSGVSLANAIISTLKVTSTPSTALTNIASLDTLSAALNKLIAQGSAPASFAAMLSATPTPTSPAVTAPAVSTYSFNGRTAAQLQQKLSDYAKSNYQLGKFQVTGCADDPAPTKACTYVLVSANVTNGAGKLVEIFSDAVVYNKATTPAWLLAGNGRATDIALYPVAYANFGFDGKLTAAATTTTTDTTLPPELQPAAATNPGSGIQIVVRATNDAGTSLLTTAIAQLPSGYSVRLVQCGAAVMCISSNPPAVPTYSGELDNTLFQKPVIGWIGNKDGTAGAKYLVSTFVPAGRTLQPSVYLPADVPQDLSLSLMPLPDAMSGGAALDAATLIGAGTISWANWAAANPSMKIILVRRIINIDGAAPIISDTAVPPDRTISVATTAMTVPDGVFVTTYQLWMAAEDNLGRRYFSKISTVPLVAPAP